MPDNPRDPRLPDPGAHGVEVRNAPHPSLGADHLPWVVTVDGYNLCRCWTKLDAEKVAEDLWRLRDLET